MKKITGDQADEHYVDKRTGVCRLPEFTGMSRGGRGKEGNAGGIGQSWYRRYKDDVYPWGNKVVNGVEVRAPKYYDGLYAADDPLGFAKLKVRRNSLISVVENTVARLLVKEELALLKVNRLKRELEEVGL